MSYEDGNGDPLQYGVHGWQEFSQGTTPVGGLALGVVLSVQPADSESNEAYAMLSEDGAIDSTKSSYIECSCLVTFMAGACSFELPHCLVLQGKSSMLGPTKDEGADFTEDIPNGCTPEEISSFWADGETAGFENLSGDRVVIGFIGGLLQMPIIIGWLPNPGNKKDAGTKADGKRFRLRRNNSELTIDGNGNISLTHRVGQYIQFKEEKITVKHRHGQTIHLDENGSVFVADKEGRNVTIDSNGISMVTKNSAIQLTDDNINITTKGTLTMTADKISLAGGTLSTGSGATSGVPIAKGDLYYLVKAISQPLLSVLEVLTSLKNPLNVPKELIAASTKLTSAAVELAKLTTVVPPNTQAPIDKSSNYVTSMLRGE